MLSTNGLVHFWINWNRCLERCSADVKCLEPPEDVISRAFNGNLFPFILNTSCRTVSVTDQVSELAATEVAVIHAWLLIVQPARWAKKIMSPLGRKKAAFSWIPNSILEASIQIYISDRVGKTSIKGESYWKSDTSSFKDNKWKDIIVL